MRKTKKITAKVGSRKGTAAQISKAISTISGLEVRPLYTPGDVGKGALGRPGEYPFTRGVHETMYRKRLWTMRQYAGFGTAAEANARYRYLLSQGTTGLSVAFDLPTQMGRDPGHPLSKGEVGKVGVSIASIEDMEILLQEIPIEKISISMTINATAAILLAFLLAVAKRRGVPWKVLNGTIQNDILKEYIARGTYIYPPTPALRIVTDIFEFCSKEVPQWNTISISGYHIREAGSTAVQELAFTLADGIAYVEAALARGLKVDDFAPRLAFFFNCHNDFLEEVAKFRAARRMWARIMKKRFKAKDPRSMMLRFHTQTAGSSLTAQQPLNNVVRTTIQALAAVCGGTQSLHTNSYDEALGLPTTESATLALRTQQIIAHESGIGNSADPLGGSYLIESFTDRLESETLRLIDEIDGRGGMVAAIEERFPQGEIERSAYLYQRSIESGERVVVGVNKFDSHGDRIPEVQKLDPKGEQESVARIRRIIEERDEKSVSKVLSDLRHAASTNRNLMLPIVAAAESFATLGEIADVLREQFGVYSH